MKEKMSILHVSEIDNDFAKGTSVVIPQYIIFQKKLINNVAFLNCNDIELEKLNKINNVYKKSDNANMKVIKRTKPSLVIFHEVYKTSYLKLYKYCLKNNIPYIIIPHGCLTLEAQKHKRIKKILGNIIFFNNFLKNAAYIQYLSESECYRTKYKRLDYYILGNGLPDIPEKNSYKVSKQNSQSEFKFIYVGRYDYLIKGLDKLILASSLIREEMLEKKIKINLYGIGNKKSEKAIKNGIKKYNLENIILLNGPIYGIKKRKKILENDAFIQVSRTEGQPLGVMEAMTLGMPLLISEETGLKKIVENNKCGVTTKCDEKMISEAILEMYNLKDKLKEFSENAYSYAKNNFSWNYIATLTMEKYNKILKEMESKQCI